MVQNLGSVDIYQCPFFEVDSNGKLKFISGSFYNRTPESFKTIHEIYDVTRYCMWIIKKKETLDVSKYSAIAFMNRVNEKMIKIEKEYAKIIKSKQLKQEENLKNSIDNPGKTYL